MRKRALNLSSSSGDQLADPTIGAHYGICLGAAKGEKAWPYLEFGEMANLLREEKALFGKAYLNWDSQRRTQQRKISKNCPPAVSFGAI
jgi:hypothetical protein